MSDRLSVYIARVATFRVSDLTSFMKREDGQGVTEYGLVLAFVAIALAAVLAVLHTEITAFINTVGNDLEDLPGAF
jgi:Flp pilus assembly pilin Flp